MRILRKIENQIDNQILILLFDHFVLLNAHWDPIVTPPLQNFHLS